MIIKTPVKGILPPDQGKAEFAICEVFAAEQRDSHHKELKTNGFTAEVYHFGTTKLRGGLFYVADDETGVILHPLGG